MSNKQTLIFIILVRIFTSNSSLVSKEYNQVPFLFDTKLLFPQIENVNVLVISIVFSVIRSVISDIISQNDFAKTLK